MTNQNPSIAKAQSMSYEGSIKLSFQDISYLLDGIYSARREYPENFDLYSETFLKISAMETEMKQELWKWEVKQELEEQKRQAVEKRKAVDMLLARARLEYAQKSLAEAQENAA